MRGIINLCNNYEKVTFWNREKTSLREYPHQDIYDSLFEFLKSVGFVQYKDRAFNKEFSSLSKTHHQFKSQKNSLLIYCEIYPTGFKVAVGHSKNCLKDGCLSFWKKYDYRRKVNSYIENIRVRAMLEKITNHFVGFDVEIRREKKLTAVEQILKEESENTHVHGSAKCLEDIKKYVENNKRYHFENEAKDKDNKKLTCGEIKYFYDYDGILKRGEIWHHINNMWWVLCEKKRYNKSSFELFDYSPSMPLRKNRLPENRIRKLEKVLKTLEEKRDYQKCIIINNLIEQTKQL